MRSTPQTTSASPPSAAGHLDAKRCSWASGRGGDHRGEQAAAGIGGGLWPYGRLRRLFSRQRSWNTRDRRPAPSPLAFMAGGLAVSATPVGRRDRRAGLPDGQASPLRLRPSSLQQGRASCPAATTIISARSGWTGVGNTALNVKSGKWIFNGNVFVGPNGTDNGNVYASQFLASQGISADGGKITLGNQDLTTYDQGINIGGGAVAAPAPAESSPRPATSTLSPSATGRTHRGPARPRSGRTPTPPPTIRRRSARGRWSRRVRASAPSPAAPLRSWGPGARSRSAT